MKENKKEEYDWYKENAERGAFALTKEELEFYFNPDRWKTPTW